MRLVCALGLTAVVVHAQSGTDSRRRTLDELLQMLQPSREGEHETTAGDVENFVDFFDAVFGRRAHAKVETWVHGYTFDEWEWLAEINR